MKRRMRRKVKLQEEKEKGEAGRKKGEGYEEENEKEGKVAGGKVKGEAGR